MKITSRSPKERPDVYLTPASSRSAQHNLAKAVEDGGLNLQDTISELQDQKSELVQIVVEFKDMKGDFDELTTEVHELEEELGINSDQIQEENITLGGFDPQDKKKLEELESKRENLNDLAQSWYDQYDRNRELLEPLFDKSFDEIEFVGHELIDTIDDRLSELSVARELLGELASSVDSNQVQLWAVRDSVGENRDFNRDDVFLFYTGNSEYQHAATVDGTFQSEELSSVLWETDNSDDSFPWFVIFQGVQEVGLDSSVIATLADHKIDYVIGFTRLNDQAKETIYSQFGSIQDFISEASESNIRESDFDLEAQPQEKKEETSTDSESAPIDRQPSTDIEEPRWSPLSGLADLAEQVAQQKLVLLCGPRGTGKVAGVNLLTETWFDQEVGSVSISNRVLQKTARPSLEYDEFVLGYNRSFTSQSTEGVSSFQEFCDLAAADTWQSDQKQARIPKYMLLIDDFHRIDPTNIFGATWPLLQKSQRGRDSKIELPGSGALLWIPESLYVVGIVNTTETRIGELPEPVHRHFRIIEVDPDYDILYSAYGIESREEAIHMAETDTGQSFAAMSILALENLNRQIRTSSVLEKRHQFGHLTLANATPEVTKYDQSGLINAWKFDILGQLPEYYSREESPWDDLLENIDTDLFREKSIRRIDEESIKHVVSELSKLR